MTTTRFAQRPGAPKKQVDAGVRQLRDIHDEGRKLRELFAKAAKRGETKIAWVTEEATKRGINRDYLWKAMMFADPETGVSLQELDTLCRLAKDNRRIVGRAFVAKLVSVPGKSRMKFAEKVLREGLTLSEIGDLLAQRYGRRREGGRRPRMLASRQNMLIGLDKMYNSWSRLFGFLDEQAGSQSSRSDVRLAGLPPEVQGAIKAVNAAMGVLREAIDGHLRPAGGKGKTSASGR